MGKLTVPFAARLLACVVLLSPVAASAFQGEITTYAGAGSGGETGDGGPATAAKIQGPGGQAMDAAGNLFFADTDNHRVRRVDASTGIITTVAGNGSQGFSGDGGAATAARLRFPRGVAVATNGDFYIADSDNHRIRLVTAATGIITTTAGDGNDGDSGDGGPATAASLDEPFDVALDASGRLTIADTGNHRIRRVSAAGIISTIAGTGSGGYGGDNGPATAADLHSPSGVAYDISSDLFIADTENNRVRKVDISLGTIRTFAGDGSSGYGGDGGSALNAKLKKPGAVALDADRHLYIADTQNNRLRRVEHGVGVIMTIAGTGLAAYGGDGGAAVSASLRNPAGIVVSAAGDAFIGDTGSHRIRRVEDPAFTECGDGVLEIGEGVRRWQHIERRLLLVVLQNRVGRDTMPRWSRPVRRPRGLRWRRFDMPGGLPPPHGNDLPHCGRALRHRGDLRRPERQLPHRRGGISGDRLSRLLRHM